MILSFAIYLTAFGQIIYYLLCGRHFVCTKGDYYDPTRSISFILPGLLARMYKSSISQNGSFVFIHFNAHHWRLSQTFYPSSDYLDWIHHFDSKFTQQQSYLVASSALRMNLKLSSEGLSLILQHYLSRIVIWSHRRFMM